MRHVIVSFRYNVLLFAHRGVTFICELMIPASKVYAIRDNKSNKMSSIYCRTRVIGIIATILISIV